MPGATPKPAVVGEGQLHAVEPDARLEESACAQAVDDGSLRLALLDRADALVDALVLEDARVREDLLCVGPLQEVVPVYRDGLDAAVVGLAVGERGKELRLVVEAAVLDLRAPVAGQSLDRRCEHVRHEARRLAVRVLAAIRQVIVEVSDGYRGVHLRPLVLVGAHEVVHGAVRGVAAPKAVEEHLVLVVHDLLRAVHVGKEIVAALGDGKVVGAPAHDLGGIDAGDALGDVFRAHERVDAPGRVGGVHVVEGRVADGLGVQALLGDPGVEGRLGVRGVDDTELLSGEGRWGVVDSVVRVAGIDVVGLVEHAELREERLLLVLVRGSYAR